MALQTSGAISLADIQTEFGGSNPISISEYYGAASGIPTSGTISISDFYGASNLSTMSTTNYMRLSSSGNSVYGSYSVTGAIAVSVIAYYITITRSDPYVYIYVREVATSPTSYWYNTSGTATALSTTNVTMGRFNLTGITDVKIAWSVSTATSGGPGILGNATVTSSTAVSTYGATNDTWQALSNGQSLGVKFQTQATAECYASGTKTGTMTFDVYARKSGYYDTALGTYKAVGAATATSTYCF